MIHHEIHPDRTFGGGEAGLGDPESAKIAVIPAPLEATVSYGGGTAAGPERIIRASAELEFFCDERHSPYWENGDVVTLQEAFDPNASNVEALERLESIVREVITRDLFPVTLGGEHAITYAPVKALAETAGEPFGVLFVDAHLDLRDEYDGSRWSHASVGRRIVDDLGVPGAWIGTRSVAAEEHRVVDDRGYAVAYAHQVRERGVGAAMDRVLSALPDRVYLTFDVDGLDPSVLPGTGTPEPGGLDYPQALQIIRRLATEKTIIGADFVELAPIEGQQVSEFTVAKLIAKLLAELRP